jgi:uncharacterized membrane protein
MEAPTALLAHIPLFSTMDDDERRAVAVLLDETFFDAGQHIYHAGDMGGTCYIILTGEVELSLVDEDDTRLVIDTLTMGDVFGDLSLLDGGKCTSNALALEPTTTLTLERSAFRELLRSRPDAALDVMQVLVQRVRHIDDLLRRRVSRDPNVAIAERVTIGGRVADAVARFGGSWTFIGLFAAFLLIWTLLNTVFVFYNRTGQPFDPYPFILLNLFLSMLAAIQAPIIMMSQNRQDAKDRIRAELDYQVNLKAELEIGDLHRKIDELRSELAQAKLKSAPQERGSTALQAQD